MELLRNEKTENGAYPGIIRHGGAGRLAEIPG